MKNNFARNRKNRFFLLDKERRGDKKPGKDKN